MKYRDINTVILSRKDKELLRPSSGWLYKYLLDNNVAYFYAKRLGAKKRAVENRVIREGDNYNRKFLKTLKLLGEVCKKNGVDYLVFKTLKYVPEVYAGDLDVIVKEKDFDRILEIFKKRGFFCKYEGKLKAGLVKTGYSKIESRVNVENHGIVLFESTEIWRYKEKAKLGGLDIYKTTKEFDLVCLLLNILYGPKYLDLYLILLYKQVGRKRLLSFLKSKKLAEELKLLDSKLIAKDITDKRFPIFVPDLTYLDWWAKNVFLSNKVFFLEKFKVLAFFYYIKYKYLLFNNLHFAHRWLDTDL